MEQFGLKQIREKISDFISEGILDDRVIQILKFKNNFIPKETELWDFKRQADTDKFARGKTVLQVVSFFNTYGGYLIYGVEEIVSDREFAPCGIHKNKFDIRQLKDLIRNYTGEMIDISYREIEYRFGNKDFTFGILHIPKRLQTQPPIIFGRNGPKKGNKYLFEVKQTYLRASDRCELAKTTSDFQELFSVRQNPYLSNVNHSHFATDPSIIVEHNLPDKNFICTHFVGRDKIIKELWQWLGEAFVYAKLLAGDGGKGKTSLAYEFAEEVCRTKPNNVEKVIWLTAKSKQFKGFSDKYISVPETHFTDVASLLKALCSELGLLDNEIDGASLPLIKKLLNDALHTFPCLIIVDDVDSTEQEQQKMILETAMQISNPRARFLITTRMNFSYSAATCITIGGMETNEYKEYVHMLAKRVNIKLNRGQISKMHSATDGSPLFTESLFRLFKLGMPIERSIKKWQGKMGSEVRAAALRREANMLSRESRSILLVCTLMREASLSELQKITGYTDGRMEFCIGELKSLFLLSSPKIIKSEPRFKVSNNLASLVIENQNDLVENPRVLKKMVQNLKRNGMVGKRRSGQYERISFANKQCWALLKKGDFERALETANAALQQYEDEPSILLNRGHCLLLIFEEEHKEEKLTLAREAFDKSYVNGQSTDLLFELWFRSEVYAESISGAIDVATYAIKCNARPKADWHKKRADAHFSQYEAYQRVLNPEGTQQSILACSEDLRLAVQSSKSSQRRNFLDMWQTVNDEAWKALLANLYSSVGLIKNRKLANLAEMRSVYNFVKENISSGDIRIENFDRIIVALQNIVERVSVSPKKPQLREIRKKLGVINHLLDKNLPEVNSSITIKNLYAKLFALEKSVSDLEKEYKRVVPE